jgi:DNA-binding response OmpR family regulator
LRVLLLTDPALAGEARPAFEAESVPVTSATDPGQAEAEVRAGSYDVVLLDPGQLAERDQPRLPAWCANQLCVLVLLPADAPAATRAGWLDAGADGCLLLPLCPSELRGRLRVLKRRLAPPAPVLRVHDLELDAGARAAKRSGRLILLSPREFDLLWLLARRSGQVVGRDAIRAHLYGGQDDNSSNVVDVYIRYLRRKVDEGFASPLILTCRGQGYMLRGEAG